MNVQPMEEIEKQYDKQWVLMDELVQEPNLKITAARVLFASYDKAQVHEHAMIIRPKRSAFLYMGTMEEEKDVVFVL